MEKKMEHLPGSVIFLVIGIIMFQVNSNMNALEIIGIVSLCYFGFKIALQASKCIYNYCVKGQMRRNALVKEKGRWAVITGATDGIGKAYAYALAKVGLDIVLVSRDINKLNDCARDIEAKHSVRTRVVAVDFTRDPEIYQEISNAVNDLEIGVLVNNVGISYSYPEMFLDLPEREKFIAAIIKANVISVTKMCEICMPGMVERRSGVVINISSASAILPSPMLTVYAATKSYVEKFSDELRSEYESYGLIIQTVLPGYVATKMSKIRKSTWMAPTAEKYVASALGKLGVADHTTGYFPHALFVKTVNSINNLCPPLGHYLVMRSMKNIRSRALARLRNRVTEE
ncbi:UNVERIFIED_CONTAM: hypothetical protein PYX00_009923 [Menopon gallinae]|uniref:Uncharacterized protein n=1 Tax=Menopon gallinae TaxID=328185 RepID=A0AAW2HD60_9NEOP